jgi:DNA-binding NtrC family response regulator
MTTRILLVDDFQGLLELLHKYFNIKCITAEIEECTSASDALEKMKLQQFDIIISDYDMRDMNGMDFLKFIRKMGDSTPFVLLTGVQNPNIENEAREWGAVYIPKGEYPAGHLDEILQVLRKIKKVKSV